MRFLYFGILAWNCLFLPVLGVLGHASPNDATHDANSKKDPPLVEAFEP